LTTSRKAPSFVELFGVEPTVQASAPGRVNVIGEHTDYNGGFVLPAAIPQRTIVHLAPRPDDRVEVWSREIGPAGERNTYRLGSETPRGNWLDYFQGITRVLAGEGYLLRGFQLRVESTVPVGSGLSSSAAIEISVLRALREAFGLGLSDIDLALLGQRVETEFVGAPVGIMDQMACALADEQHVLFLDTRSLVHERVAIPPAAQLVVIDSGITHSHAAGDYRRRRAECEAAAQMLGVRELRDISEAELGRLRALPDTLSRRARHVATENARVLQAVAAFRANDLPAAGALLSESHASMRDDFEISIREMDLLVRIAETHPEVYGARLTGGGFGGSAVVLARRESARRVGHLIAADYSRQSGRRATVLVPH
jgi:galactokinase